MKRFTPRRQSQPAISRAVDGLLEMLADRLLSDLNTVAPARWKLHILKNVITPYTHRDLQDGAAIRRQSHRPSSTTAERRPSPKEDV